MAVSKFSLTPIEIIRGCIIFCPSIFKIIYCKIDLLMFAPIVAVMKYLSQPRGVSRCPVIGCSSIITSDALEKDKLMERAL